MKKDDLIKTTKGNVGIIISTNKDNIKMLDTSNVIQIVGNLDYESKINTHNLVAKNKSGDQIKNQTIVRIKKGIHEVIILIFRENAAKPNMFIEIIYSFSILNLTKQEESPYKKQITV